MNRRQTSRTTNRPRSMRRNQNMVSYIPIIKMGPVSHSLIIALLVTLLGMIYLTQATGATAYDYEIQQIDEKIANLNVEKADLEVENARLSALQNVENSSVASRYEEANDVQYVPSN